MDASHATWPDGPLRPALAPGEVHLWLADLADAAGIAARLAATLSADEGERAARFRHARDRDRFRAVRGILRALLARYLGRPAAGLRFTYSAYGKPELADGLDLRFNLAHAGERAIYAVTLGRPVGVDIEPARPELATPAIAAQFFAASENEALARLGPQLWAGGFFRCWTRKEAYVKAQGLGLSLPLDRFAVTLAPGEPAALLATYDDPAEAGRWTLYDPGLAPPYVGALAVAGPIAAIRRWRWRPDAELCWP